MLEAKRRQQLSLRDLYHLNWFLGAGLALLALWAVFPLSMAVLPHALIAIGLITASAIRPGLPVLLPRLVWQAIPFLLVVVLVIDLFFSSEVVAALVRLNIMLVLYRCLSFRRKREDLQLIVLCLFLLIIAGVWAVAMSFIVQVLLFTAVAMAFLFNITLMEDSRDTISRKEIWGDFTWARFLRKLWNRCDLGFLGIAGLALSSVVISSSLLFLIIPRFDMDATLPFLGNLRSSQTGFSEAIRFGDVTDIRSNNRVALRVEVSPPEEIPLDPYWRMLVLDQYHNGGFSLSHALKTAGREANTRQVTYSDRLIGATVPPRKENVWTFYMEGGVARYLPMTGRFERLRFQESREISFLEPAHLLSTARMNPGLVVYQVENMELSGVFSDPAFGSYTLSQRWGPEDAYLARRIDYPDTTMELVPRQADVEYLQGVVEEIGRGEAMTATEFAAKAVSYLQQRHRYSTSFTLPEGEEDYVIRWLKAGSPGHCEVFAAAMILICRTVGIPSRAVTGFKGGSWNAFENYFMVRNSDAHAWVEVFDGNGNWIRFDPTPGNEYVLNLNGGQIAQGGMMGDSSFSAYLDSLRMLWYRRVVSFDQESQVRLWTMIQERISEFPVKEWLIEIGRILAHWWQSPWEFTTFIEAARVLLMVGLLALVIVFGLRRDRMTLLRVKMGSHDPIRRKAGRQLQCLKELVPSQDNIEAFEGVVFELEQLRYGPPGRSDGWRETLRRAREITRRERRRRARNKTLAE